MFFNVTSYVDMPIIFICFYTHKIQKMRVRDGFPIFKMAAKLIDDLF